MSYHHPVRRQTKSVGVASGPDAVRTGRAEWDNAFTWWWVSGVPTSLSLQHAEVSRALREAAVAQRAVAGKLISHAKMRTVGSVKRCV